MQLGLSTVLAAAVTASSVLPTYAAPFDTGTGMIPLGNLRTTDKDGPYKLQELNTSAAHVKAGIAARKNFTDHDIVDFLANTVRG